VGDHLEAPHKRCWKDRVRVRQLVGQPTVAEIRSWAAHERVSVKREEGKR